MSTAAAFALFIAFFLALVSPGQDFVTVLRLSVTRSLRIGIAAASGSATGILFWGVAAMAGVGLLLSENTALTHVLRLAGACALVAFGLYGALRALLQRPVTQNVGDDSALRRDSTYTFARGWRAGLLSNLTNVKLLIFFTTLFSSILPSDLSIQGASAILLAMAVTSFGWFAFIAMLGSRQQVAAAYRRAERGMDVLFGLVFVALGLVLVALA